jgi:hypothetical protein
MKYSLKDRLTLKVKKIDPNPLLCETNLRINAIKQADTDKMRAFDFVLASL